LIIRLIFKGLILNLLKKLVNKGKTPNSATLLCNEGFLQWIQFYIPYFIAFHQIYLISIASYDFNKKTVDDLMIKLVERMANNSKP